MLRFLLVLAYSAIAATQADAGCAELSICGKTIVAKTKYGTTRAYVSSNGDIFTTTAGGTLTNKSGNGFIGVTCSQSGTSQTIKCPGPNCTNTYRARDNVWSSTETTSCRVAYDSTGFVLQSQIQSLLEQQMHMAGQNHHQSTKQDVTSEERYLIGGKGNCSVTVNSTDRMSTTNTWMPPRDTAVPSSYQSSSCTIASGRHL